MKNNRIFRTTFMALAVAFLAAGCSVTSVNEEIGKPAFIGKNEKGEVYQRCIVTAYGQVTGPQSTDRNCYLVHADDSLVVPDAVSKNSSATPSMADGIAGNALPAAITAGGMIGGAAILRPANIKVDSKITN